MSWSENRSSENDISKEKKTNAEDKQKLEHIRQINGVLKSFSNDEDLQDDLKLQIVRAAIDHWSNIKRISTESYKQQLESDRRVASVYPKLKQFQYVCQQANCKVPLDQMLEGKSELDSKTLLTLFGKDFCTSHKLIPSLTTIQPPIATIKKETVTEKDSKEPEDLTTEEQKISIKKDTKIAGNNHATFSLRNIIVESFLSADWSDRILQTFKTQIILLFVTFLIAYSFGFASFDVKKFLP